MHQEALTHPLSLLDLERTLLWDHVGDFFCSQKSSASFSGRVVTSWQGFCAQYCFGDAVGVILFSCPWKGKQEEVILAPCNICKVVFARANISHLQLTIF